MEEAQDYYSFLGVSHNATIDDIKRAFHRKRKEYQNDEQKTLQLNIAFQFLIDEVERKKYDREHPYENRIRELKEIIKNSEDQEAVRNSFLELKKIYEEILCQDAENLEAVVTLCNIAAILENQKEVFSYLVRIEQYARTLTDSSEALECWRFLVEKYEKYEKYDEAIRLLSHVCRENADNVEDVVYLARLFYERKGDLKAALSLLNESINRSDISSSIMHYLCESLRAICIMKTENNAQVKELYKKMESLISESYSKNDRASANELANKLLIYMNDFLVTQNISVIHHLEKLYMLCLPCAQERNHIFEILQQTVKAMEAGKMLTASNEIMVVARGKYRKGNPAGNQNMQEKVVAMFQKFKGDLDKICMVNALNLKEEDFRFISMLNEISNNLESSIWTLEDFGKEGAGADEAPANEGETEVKDLGKANEKKEKKEKKQAEEPMEEAV